MPGKTKSNTWDDVKMLVAAVSVTLTIGLWNVFAAAANREAVAHNANVPLQPTANVAPFVRQVEPAPGLTGKILLGGVAPQPRVVVRSGGGGGGGGPVTQTRSS
jgi:hypothetical protein